MTPPQVHVLPWDQPLPAQAAAWLARDWSGDGPLDLADMLAIVPTRQSGRRLREALAAHAERRGQGVFPPRIVLPESLPAAIGQPPGTATGLEVRLAWAEVLRELDLAAFAEVFPVPPPQREFNWAWQLADQLFRLQSTLAESGLRIGHVVERAESVFLPEPDRWKQLAALEAACDAALGRRQRRHPHAAAIAAGARPPEGIARIAVVGAPDPLPFSIDLLAALAQRVPVDVLVFGPAETPAAALFDAWGRPTAAEWAHRPVPLADFQRHVHLCAGPAEQAALAAAWAKSCAPAEGRLTIGVADPKILAPLRSQLAQVGIATFDPAGQPRRREGLHHLLTTLAAFAREPAFEHVEALARCPDVLAWLGSESGAGFSCARLLAGLDELHARHLPQTLEAARAFAEPAADNTPTSWPELAPALDPAEACGLVAARRPTPWPELAPALDRLAELRVQLTHGSLAERTQGALAAIFRQRHFELHDADDARAVDTAGHWSDTLRATTEALAEFPKVAVPDAWEIALQSFGETTRFDEKTAGALELQGWLELLWEDAPRLVVVGLNDHRVPGGLADDGFLPESLRQRLGLRTDATRLARDNYLLHAIAASRAAAGRIDLALGKTSAAGDPLRPSRLLLLCDDVELPARVNLLFREVGGAGTVTPWQRAWRLEPVPDAPLAHVRVTAFRDYLKCPFRFYLRHALRMQPVDPSKSELDARDFGTLCHAALEAMARDAAMSRCAEAGALRAFLHRTLDAEVERQFGRDLTVPLRVQVESARQRLARAAEVQARLRGEGWLTERVEWKFTLAIGGIEVRGTIDRIDRHEPTGRIRVLDYKTSDKPVDPRSAHLRRPGRREDPGTRPDYARCEVAGGDHVWSDLQLPLYLRALAPEFGPEIECGYFNLPKATTETTVSLWDGFDAAWAESAARCADGVAADVATRRFWPPAEIEPDRDDFAALFHHGTADSVAWRESPPAPGAPEPFPPAGSGFP